MNSYIRNKPWTFLSIAAVLSMVTLLVQVDTGHCLKTDLTPGGILSLEMAWEQAHAENIRSVWQAPCRIAGPVCKGNVETSRIITLARINILWDFAFIASYFCLLYVLVVVHESKFSRVTYRPLTGIVSIICLAASTLDVAENILMLQFLKGTIIKSWYFALAAIFKFIGVGLVALYILWRGAYLQRFSAFTITLVQILWANRVSVIALLVLYLALWKSDQGQDLLINLNASHWGPVTFYIILSIMATFYWYWPKYFSPDKWRDPSKVSVTFKSLFCGNWSQQPRLKEETYVPRLLGVLIFIVPACGILQALNIFEIPHVLDFFSPSLLLIISIVFFLVMMENEIFENFFGYAPRLYVIVILGLLVLILGLGLLNKYSANQLGLLSLGLYALAFIFIMVTSVRGNPDLYRLWFFSKLRDRRANAWMLTFVTIAALAFFVFNCVPNITADGQYRFMTLPVVLTGIVFYSFIFFLLMIWGKRKAINFSAFLIVFAIVIAVVVDNKYHDVKTIDRLTKNPLPSLSDYIHHWILTRKDEILKRRDSYPVFIVNSYGGGIRAAAWTTFSVAFLDSITSGKFQDHVLAYSGASGGTIGSSILCAVKRNNMMDSFRTRDALNFYQNDFLTPVLIGLFGRDVWFSTLGISWFDDRARLQDKIWERHIRSYANDYYESEFSSLWYPNGKADYKIPLLFSNTYHVEKGLKAVLAPVSLDTAEFESAVIVNNILKEKSIQFSTGSFLSARFPYISPAAKLDNGHHFLDGGLKENSGAETAEEIFLLYQHLADTVVGKDSLRVEAGRVPTDTVAYLYSKIRIYFVSLNNSVEVTDDPGPTRNLVELAAPFEALYNNWVGNTAKADSILRLRHHDQYFELRPTATCVDGFRPVLPLGWQISNRALTGMIQSLKTPCSNNLKNLDCIARLIAEDTISRLDCVDQSLPCRLTASIQP